MGLKKTEVSDYDAANILVTASRPRPTHRICRADGASCDKNKPYVDIN